MPYPFLIALATLLCALAGPAQAQKFPGLADTPPMGWNSWNKFGCDIDEKLVRETAEAMVATGMKAAGYQYVNLDDCWHGARDADGFIQADPQRFPSGMKALADHVHGLGLKIGLYSDAGTKTCGGKPGSQGHEYQDALQYARWGIDYLKYDWCNTGEDKARRSPREAYTTMRDAIHAAGRPMVFSMCEWGDSKPWEWAGDTAHLWRTSGDIAPCWECEVGHGNWSSLGVLNTLDKQAGLRQHAKPGQWNDPDMMQVGNLPTLAENRAHFGLWVMLAAPLIVGTDLRKLPEDIRRVLTHPALIAINQDPLGIQGYAAIKSRNLEVWVKPLQGKDWAVAFLNRADSPLQLTHDWRQHPLEDNLHDRSANFAQARHAIQDLWTGLPAGTTDRPLARTVAAHDLLMFRLTPER